MPRNPNSQLSFVQKVRKWAREQEEPIGFDLSYALMKAAIVADGLTPQRELPDSELNPLSDEDQARLAAAKSALGIA